MEEGAQSEDREKWGGVLFVPEHLPKSIGDWQLAEAGEERTVWRRFRTAPAGKFNFCRGGVPFLKEQRCEWSERVAQ
jgi:hypothetical protein